MPWHECLLTVLTVLAAAGDQPTADEDRSDPGSGSTVEWIALPDARLQICGLPWFD